MPTAFFPALADRNVRIYLSGQTVSVLGHWTQTITLNLVVYELTGSAALLGIANFLLHGPMLFVAPIAGKYIGQPNARRIATVVMLAAGAGAAAIGLLATMGILEITALLCYAGMCGVLSAAEMPARQVLLTSSVQEGGTLANAIAMSTLSYNLGRTIGPAIAALLFVQVGAGAGFFLYTGTLLVMTRCLKMIKIADGNSSTKERATIAEAFRHVASTSFTALFLAVIALLGLFAGSYQTLIPVLADKAFGNTAAFTGILFAFAGGGSLTAAIALSSRYANDITRTLLAGAPWLSVISLAALSFATSVALAAAALYALGFTLTLVSATTNSSMQRSSPPRLRGAIAGLYAMAFLGTLPLGHLLMGALASHFNVRAAFLVSALVLAVSFALLYRRKWNTDRTIVGAFP
jgi:predicted MFS family arabinose efflux permease